MGEAVPGYEHDLYEFEAAGVTYVARSYLAEPEEAHFLRKEVDGEQIGLTEEDLGDPCFQEAVAYLRGSGKVRIEYLSMVAEGYVEVPM